MIEVGNEGERVIDIVDKIDQAIGCQYCGGSLDGSPSRDFCTYGHQRAWHDLFRRLGSAEKVTEELREEQRRRRETAAAAAAMVREINDGMMRLGPAVGQAFRPFTQLAQAANAAFAGLGHLLAEAGLLPNRAPENPARRALWLRQHRNTGPKPVRQRPPRTLNRW